MEDGYMVQATSYVVVSGFLAYLTGPNRSIYSLVL